MASEHPLAASGSHGDPLCSIKAFRQTAPSGLGRNFGTMCVQGQVGELSPVLLEFTSTLRGR